MKIWAQKQAVLTIRHSSWPLKGFWWCLEKWKWSCLVVSNSLWPMDCNLSSSSDHGIFQARVLEWVAISFSRGSSWPRARTRVSHIRGRRFNLWATREANGNPLQYSCLENPMVREAWWATVHGVAKELDTTEWLNTLRSRKAVGPNLFYIYKVCRSKRRKSKTVL